MKPTIEIRGSCNRNLDQRTRDEFEVWPLRTYEPTSAEIAVVVIDAESYDRMTRRIEWAEQLIKHALELMTTDQYCQWTGVRAWAECFDAVEGFPVGESEEEE